MRELNRKKTTILYDNDVIIVRELKAYLEDEGFRVFVVSSEKELLKRLKKQNENIDLIILDVMIPHDKTLSPVDTRGGMETGKVLARMIRKTYPKISIVAFSATDDNKIKEWFEKYCCGFIPKPFKDDFIDKVNQAIANNKINKKPQCSTANGSDNEHKTLLPLENAHKWLICKASNLEFYVDQEAIVYLKSRGHDCNDYISEINQCWREAEKNADNQYYFWGGRDQDALIVDATMFRTAKWCDIGGFESWWERYAKDTKESTLRGGVPNTIAGSNWLFNMLRSDYARKLMLNTLDQTLNAIEASSDYEYPWEAMIPQEKVGKCIYFDCASAVIFAYVILRGECKDSKIVKSAAELLLKHQEGGAWKTIDKLNKPSIETTAKAIHALCVLKPHGWERPVNDACKWLWSMQNDQGYWQESSTNSIYLTVLVLDAIGLSNGSDQLTFSIPENNSSDEMKASDEKAQKTTTIIKIKELIMGDKYKNEGSAGIVGPVGANEVNQKLNGREDTSNKHKTYEGISVFVFGVTFVITILVLAFKYPEPTDLQYTVLKTVLALAVAGVAAFIPGFIDVNIKGFIRAGGALAVFAVVYFYSPADLVVQTHETINPTDPISIHIVNDNSDIPVVNSYTLPYSDIKKILSFSDFTTVLEGMTSVKFNSEKFTIFRVQDENIIDKNNFMNVTSNGNTEVLIVANTILKNYKNKHMAFTDLWSQVTTLRNR